MKRTILRTVVGFYLIFYPLPSGHAFFASDMDKARELINVERYHEADKILDKILVDNPTDAEDYFDVGKTYLDMGWDSKAENVFDILVRKLDSSYRDKVANLFILKGDKTRAMKFDPGLKAKVARDAMIRGEYEEALRLDPSLKPQVCNDLLSKADKVNDEDCFTLYQEAAKYCSNDTDRIKQAGKRLEKIADQIQAQNLTDQRVKKYLVLAKQFNDQVRDYSKTYGYGEYKFKLANQETNGHWIDIDEGLLAHCQFFSGSKNYEVIFENGLVIKPYKGEKLPKQMPSDFMIRGVNNGELVLIIIEPKK